MYHNLEVMQHLSLHLSFLKMTDSFIHSTQTLPQVKSIIALKNDKCQASLLFSGKVSTCQGKRPGFDP